MPPTAYPMPSTGGPTYLNYMEVPPKYLVTEIGYQDGGMDFNLDAQGAIRTFRIFYDGLTAVQAKVLDDHHGSAFHRAFGFGLTTPAVADPPSEVLANVHYLTYERPEHKNYNIQSRTVTLIKYPT